MIDLEGSTHTNKLALELDENNEAPPAPPPGDEATNL